MIFFLARSPTQTGASTILLFPLYASFDSSCLFLNGVPVPAQPSPRLLSLLLLLFLILTFTPTPDPLPPSIA